MGIILAIDFGIKRTGIAVTDPLQMIASGLTTIETSDLMPFLTQYVKEHNISLCVIGLPKQMDNSPSEVEPHIATFITHLNQKIPSLEVVRYDERFTSKIAFQTMIDGGLKKKQRKKKGLIDKISATLLLQAYLDASLHAKKKR